MIPKYAYESTNVTVYNLIDCYILVNIFGAHDIYSMTNYKYNYSKYKVTALKKQYNEEEHKISSNKSWEFFDFDTDKCNKTIMSNLTKNARHTSKEKLIQRS